MDHSTWSRSSYLASAWTQMKAFNHWRSTCAYSFFYIICWIKNISHCCLWKWGFQTLQRSVRSMLCRLEREYHRIKRVMATHNYMNTETFEKLHFMQSPGQLSVSPLQGSTLTVVTFLDLVSDGSLQQLPRDFTLMITRTLWKATTTSGTTENPKCHWS